MLAVCDKRACGKKLEGPEGEFFVDPHFYKEDEGNKDIIKAMLIQAADANLVGKEAVECGIELGLIDKEAIIMLGDVPHAIFSIMH